ncbi:hypothetical protein VTN00DRAFT_684 [Thermoascus crustaceus]|uniref:uncharacterized protein n=1 Tax=Thermoascus crustaceus TaxID=5088 RepID=UPI003744B0B7
MSTSDTVLLFDAGAGTAQGGRPFQEDRHTIILPDQFPAQTSDKLAFFAVYDGHGSELVAEHASKNLHTLLVKRPEFERGDYEGAIKGALEDEDSILLESFMKDNNTEPAVVGSTVALCFVNLTKGIMVVGNLGDSHIILAQRDASTEMPYNIQRLTRSHKPNLPSEKARIERAGGSVHNYTGTARLGTLNMSRALGDLQYKNPINTIDGEVNQSSKARRAVAASPEARGDFLSHEPHLSRVTLTSDKRYALVAMTDGVCDSTDDGTLVGHVMKKSMRGERAADIAQEIASLSASSTGSDNATCLVVFMDGVSS